MKNKLLIKTYLIAITLVVCFCSCNILNNSKGDWESDLLYLKTELPKKHINLFSSKSKEDYFSGVDKIIDESHDLNDFQIGIKLQQLIASFGDSHSKIGWEQYLDKSKRLPLQLYWFSDGIYILGTTQNNLEILGQKIIQINGRSVETIVDSLRTLLTIDNEAVVKSSVPTLLTMVQVLEYFNFVNNDKVQLKIEDWEGYQKKYDINPAYMKREDRVMLDLDSVALCFRKEKVLFTDYYLEKNKIYYLQYNRCWSRELQEEFGNKKNIDKFPSFEAFEKKVFKTINTAEIKKIVVDLRFNKGGNSIQGKKFIKKISSILEREANIELFVILGRFTASSAILNAMDLKKIPKAIFVGEETFGKPNHYGDVRNFKLPKSGLKINYSTKFFKRVDVELNTLSPDVEIETSYDDFVKGIDPILEWIKGQ